MINVYTSAESVCPVPKTMQIAVHCALMDRTPANARVNVRRIHSCAANFEDTSGNPIRSRWGRAIRESRWSNLYLQRHTAIRLNSLARV